jgi:DNA-binding CsgD family transcriptional regulator
MWAGRHRGADVEHIYNKIGVSGRAAAVFYAMQHQLIP